MTMGLSRAAMLLLSAPLALAGIPGTINRAGHMTVEDPLTEATRRRLDDAPNPYTCPNPEGKKYTDEDWKVMGPNLGGWLVLEPWITPSLFYQFLNSDDVWGTDSPAHTGMDSFTFCSALGPVEGNKQMRRHWKTWVREEDIKSIADSGANALRIPVGDWMYVPYGPYIGCMDGALDELARVLDLCQKYKIKVLLDIHAVRFSQNGFDNSGQALAIRWTEMSSQDVLDPYTTFEHWPIRSADWIGKFDLATGSYPEINTTNIDVTLSVVKKMVDLHKDHPAIWGLEPVNEPWQSIPLEPLKKFYWDAYHIVRKGQPKWMFVMHDSFRGYPAAWWDFMRGCPQKAMDSHIYQAWNRPGIIQTYHANACNFRGGVRVMEDLLDMPIIVGEWSLATDNCAMWLNGFNDNLPGYPKVSCHMFECAAPYMGSEQPGAPPDPEMPLPGPYGTGVSGPQFGKCPVGVEWGSNEDEYMEKLTMKHLNSFNSVHGWFFWNFRTEMEPRWSFIDAHFKGWFPGNVSNAFASEVTSACPAPTMQANTMALRAAAAEARPASVLVGMVAPFAASAPPSSPSTLLPLVCGAALVVALVVGRPDQLIGTPRGRALTERLVGVIGVRTAFDDTETSEVGYAHYRAPSAVGA